ncbi:RNA recognition motif-containing protein [Spironucleus salmonicida]|uniref:RNA recognition motif-containing protein n=1 Tax=Spironucleus salmonicida TaxID=348837 RepID=V6LVS4_9EUKA|nr:RNA recognition motif-containing protein [Spironucleus salmonicida]|eukprot:EST48660.1 hypothetical protein SS50377_11273 [Spironucleus salmonicida]
MTSDIDFRQLAIEQLAAEKQFPPIKQDYSQSIVIIENLPVVAAEKIKLLRNKIVQTMVKEVTEKFSKNQIILHPEGGSCILSFNLIKEAKEFLNKFDKSCSIFGPKYELSVKLWSNIINDIELNPPQLREPRQVNMEKVFNHLMEDQVVSRLVLEFNNGNSQYCRFNNCLGLIRDNKCLINNLLFTPKGNFQISYGGNAIEVYNEDDKFTFPIVLNEFETINYFVSKCERFLCVILSKKLYDKTFFKYQIYSIFEEYQIFESLVLTAFNTIEIKNHVNFSYTGNHMYVLNGADEQIILYETQPEGSQIYNLTKINQFTVSSLTQIEFSPVSDLLGVFCLKKNLPSSFFLVNPNKPELQQKVLTRNLNISNAYFLFSLSGDTVSIISDNTTKKVTQNMIQQIKITTHFPVVTFKLPINQKAMALVIYNQDVIFCDKEKVYMLNEKGEADVILELPCTRLEYCEVTRTLLCIHEGIPDKLNFVKTRIVFIDIETRMTLLSFEQPLVNFSFDPYRRYVFLVQKNKLTVYSTAGNQIFDQALPEIKSLIFRPEDPKETSPSKELRDKAVEEFDLYFNNYVIMEKNAIIKRSNENAELRLKTKEAWAKTFYSEKELKAQSLAREIRLTQIRKVYPEYLQDDLQVFQIEFKLKISEEKITIARNEFESILLSQE